MKKIALLSVIIPTFLFLAACGTSTASTSRTPRRSPRRVQAPVRFLLLQGRARKWTSRCKTTPLRPH